MAASTTNQDLNQVYQDLIGFLKSDRVDLRVAATQAVLQVTDRQEIDRLVHQQYDILDPLLKICSDTTSLAGLYATQALVQWSSIMSSSSEHWAARIPTTISRLVEVALTTTFDGNNNNVLLYPTAHVNFALAMIANLTREEAGAIAMVGTTLPDHAVYDKQQQENNKRSKPQMELLLDRFLNRQYILQDAQGPYYKVWKQQNDDDDKNNDDADDPNTSYDHDDDNDRDPYQHFAGILMNIAQVPAGRQFLMKLDHQRQSVLHRIFRELTMSKNPIRRRGIAGVFRNVVCMEGDSVAWWLLHEVQILTPLLLPLAGPEYLELEEKQGMDPDLWLAGPDKEREPDATTRLLLVETVLLLLATGRASRDFLRKAKTYVILRNADMVEESEAVGDRINECVQYLRRDEEGTAEGSSDQLVHDATTPRRRLLLSPSTTASVVGTTAADYDAVD